jgi:chemotaxis protein MotB
MRRSGHKGASHERWLVSYADFITLMFAFFVVLYASAQADQKKQAQMADSIDSAFRALGIFPSPARKASLAAGPAGTDKPVVPMNIVMGEDVLAPAQVKQDLERIRGELMQTLSNQVAGHTVSIRMGRDGLIISLREAGFFNSGSASPKPATLATLRTIAASLGRTPYDLRVEGHTDNVPIHTAEFDSNWELSSARATRIARLLVDKGLIAPERISAAGYAEYHPVASNDTAEGRAENRRVDLVVSPRTTVNFAASGPSGPDGEWRKITDVQ